ncbi:hypothetical protein ACFVVA_38080 [Kitasatospora sp. NPDC058048]|uniref:hypothetical protein n=1 Tax=Kitasatospora sp. NPDC058048 TaxID=3346313 RepID=UPI0036D9200F
MSTQPAVPAPAVHDGPEQGRARVGTARRRVGTYRRGGGPADAQARPVHLAAVEEVVRTGRLDVADATEESATAARERARAVPRGLRARGHGIPGTGQETS